MTTLTTPAEKRALQIARALRYARGVKLTTCNVWQADALRYRHVGEVTVRFGSVDEARRFEALVGRLRSED